MQPTPTNRPEDLPRQDSENVFSEPAPVAENASMFGAPGPHASVPGSIAAGQVARPRGFTRSLAMWLLPLVALALLAAIAFIASRGEPANGGNIRGPGNEGAAPAPADYKRP